MLCYLVIYVDCYYMVYWFDVVDVYECKFVKQIEIVLVIVEDVYNKLYVWFVGVLNWCGVISVCVEFDVVIVVGVKCQIVLVIDGDDFECLIKCVLYVGLWIGEVYVVKGVEYVELCYLEGEVFLLFGEVFGDIDMFVVQCEMICCMICEYFDKELCLVECGVKVLLLFFVDLVECYCCYDENGMFVKGDYVLIFEEEYVCVVCVLVYCVLFDGVDIVFEVECVYNGYFLIDCKGGWIDMSESSVVVCENVECVYGLIMCEKEVLLLFDMLLKFIFLYLVLKEGWDNLNVFQICMLCDIQIECECCQMFGCGLCFVVDQDGECVCDVGVNMFIVIVIECYELFVENLQKEIEVDMGICFGIVE